MYIYKELRLSEKIDVWYIKNCKVFNKFKWGCLLVKLNCRIRVRYEVKMGFFIFLF